MRPIKKRTAKPKVRIGGSKTIKPFRSAIPRKNNAKMNKSKKNFIKKLPTVATRFKKFCGTLSNYSRIKLWRIPDSNRWPLACHASALAN